jgi:hypothetical protein
MADVFDSFRRGFAQARADTARPSRREPAALETATATGANGAGVSSEQKSLAEVTALAEQYEMRVNELEAELAASPAEIYAEVLRLPGVRQLLKSRFHPDKLDINDGERQWMTERMQKVNAAYAALDKKGE